MLQRGWTPEYGRVALELLDQLEKRIAERLEAEAYERAMEVVRGTHNH